MITNATLYLVVSEPDESTDARACFDAAPFIPCAPTQQISSGWVPPRSEDNGALLEIVHGHWIAKLCTETKKVPADVLNRLVKEQCKEIEAATGRKPGKKQTRELKEEALITLLPAAFPSRVYTLVWIDVANKMVVVDTASSSRADVVVSELIRCQEGLALAPISAMVSPAAAMAEWLFTQESPADFTVDRDLDLKAVDESKAKVKYTNHDLFIPEVKEHLTDGMLPVNLAMTWDDRASFVLTDAFVLKKIEFLDDNSVPPDEQADAFDANVILMAHEMSHLVPDLLLALGGEQIATTKETE